MIALALFSFCCLIVGIAHTIVIVFRPALHLTQAGLQYRGLYVPWGDVRDVIPFTTNDGRGLGITIDPARFSEDRPKGRREKAMHVVIRRRGVLPIPPMKGISTDDLRSLMLKESAHFQDREF
jgi:hypothetical protein